MIISLFINFDFTEKPIHKGKVFFSEYFFFAFVFFSMFVGSNILKLCPLDTMFNQHCLIVV